MTPEQKLVHTLLVMYGEPNTPDPKLYIDTFTKAIGGFSAADLEKAGENVIRKSTFWPKPSEIVSEANRLVALRSPSPHALPPVFDERPPLTPEQKANLNELRKIAHSALTKVDDMLGPLPSPPKVDRNSFEAMRAASNNVIHRKGVH
jgi:hypothetical protein